MWRTDTLLCGSKEADGLEVAHDLACGLVDLLEEEDLLLQDLRLSVHHTHHSRLYHGDDSSIRIWKKGEEGEVRGLGDIDWWRGVKIWSMQGMLSSTKDARVHHIG